MCFFGSRTLLNDAAKKNNLNNLAECQVNRSNNKKKIGLNETNIKPFGAQLSNKYRLLNRYVRHDQKHYCLRYT